MDDDYAEMIAGERSQFNATSPTHLGILRDPARIDAEGVAGELAFAKRFGFATSAVHAHGPTKENFILADGTRVDVRTSRAAKFLMVPMTKVDAGSADVYVLARYSPARRAAFLLGWATLDEMQRSLDILPVTGGIRAYIRDAKLLRPIEALLARHTDAPRQGSLL